MSLSDGLWYSQTWLWSVYESFSSFAIVLQRHKLPRICLEFPWGVIRALNAFSLRYFYLSILWSRSSRNFGSMEERYKVLSSTYWGWVATGEIVEVSVRWVKSSFSSDPPVTTFIKVMRRVHVLRLGIDELRRTSILIYFSCSWLLSGITSSGWRRVHT